MLRTVLKTVNADYINKIFLFFWIFGVDKAALWCYNPNAINSYLGCDFIKNTIQKEAVTRALFMLNHPTAEDVFEYIHCEYPSISKATVYRILNRMSDDGEIIHLEVSSGPDRFDTTISEHHHIKCSICGKICDVYLPELSKIEERIKNESGFSVSKSLVFFEGTCPECMKNANSHDE